MIIYKSLSKALRDNVEIVIFAMILAFILRSVFVSVYRIPTGAMAPEILAGDFIFADKTAYGFSLKFWNDSVVQENLIKRGDVVMFTCPKNLSSHCIKRVVGLPGDVILISGNEIKSVNGVDVEYEGVELAKSDTLSLREPKFESILGAKWQVLGLGASKAEPVKVSVPKGSLFVLGDNREISFDSRIWGMVPVQLVHAKAKRVWLSLDWQQTWANGALPGFRWKRFFKQIR